MSTIYIKIEVDDISRDDATDFAKALMLYAENTDFFYHFQSECFPEDYDEDCPIKYWIKDIEEVPRAVINWLNIAASGIHDHIENTLYDYQQEGEEIDRETIECLIESTTELALSDNEYHIQQAVQYYVEEYIDIDDLLEKYGE